MHERAFGMKIIACQTRCIILRFSSSFLDALSRSFILDVAYISTVAHTNFLRFHKFSCFFMTLDFSPLYFIRDASSSGF